MLTLAVFHERRFPFLILDAARAAGHDVTIIALKEEAFPELEAAAAQAPSATLHRVSLGQLGTWVNLLKKARVTHAVMAGQVKHTSRPATVHCPFASGSTTANISPTSFPT